jgi:hypothetical protein
MVTFMKASCEAIERDPCGVTFMKASCEAIERDPCGVTLMKASCEAIERDPCGVTFMKASCEAIKRNPCGVSLMNAAAAALVMTAAATPASANSVRHVPPAEADAGANLELQAEVDRAWKSTIEVHTRPIGGEWTSTEFQRTESAWLAVIPGDQVATPGIEYFIVSRAGDGRQVPEFASAESPHLVVVRPAAEDLRRERDLARSGGRRSRLSASGEWVDFGSRNFRLMGETERIPDRYYRLDASFSYLLLTYPLKAIRIGYTRLLGTTPDAERGNPLDCGNQPDCEIEAGFKVGGWVELRFSLVDGVEVDGRASVMATTEGFKIGGRGEFRVGVEEGSHVALGAEAVADIGASAFFRLGWDTVPSLPMAATVELLDYPHSRRAAGVRLIYDIARPLQHGIRVGLRLAYQARDERVGGFGGGLHASMDF